MKMSNVIVLFEAILKKDKINDYLSIASSLKKNLENAEGFIRSERFSSLSVEGKLLSVSIWESEESVKKWRNFSAHRIAQKHGRLHDYVDYSITVVTPLRTYTMTNREHAPSDSNIYLEVI